MKSFADLKKNAADINKKIADTLTQENTSTPNETDERLWYPQRDAAGNGSAIIRFLPAAPGCDVPYVKVEKYAFKNEETGKWYMENSLRTLGKEDPVAEAFGALWMTGDEAKRNRAKKFNRQINYYFNVYVIKDSQNPENNGKVKLLRGGQMWYNFVKAKLIPEFDDMESVPVFDFWKGANFRIRIKTEKMSVNGKEVLMPKYDASTWDSPSALFDDDDKLQEIWEQQHNLSEFIDPSQFKSYDELKKRFDSVMGNIPDSYSNRTQEAEKPKEMESTKVAKTIEESAPWEDSEDDDLALFAKLAADD